MQGLPGLPGPRGPPVSMYTYTVTVNNPALTEYLTGVDVFVFQGEIGRSLIGDKGDEVGNSCHLATPPSLTSQQVFFL